LEQVNLVFTIIFTSEIVIKLIGYKLRYFKDSWNIFDLIIVVLSIIGLILTAESDSNLGSQTTIIRSFRIIKIFYIFKRNKALKSTLMTFMISFPAMANIGSLLLLLNLIYAVLGVYLFAEVMPTPGIIDDHTNF
jgi:Ion transport protein